MEGLNLSLRTRREVVTVKDVIEMNKGSAAEQPSIKIIDTEDRTHTIYFLYCKRSEEVFNSVKEGSRLEIVIKEYVSDLNILPPKKKISPSPGLFLFLIS